MAPDYFPTEVHMTQIIFALTAAIVLFATGGAIANHSPHQAAVIRPLDATPIGPV
jgi:hypothetical protein